MKEPMVRLTLFLGSAPYVFNRTRSAADELVKSIQQGLVANDDSWITITVADNKLLTIKKSAVAGFELEEMKPKQKNNNRITIKDLARIFGMNPITVVRNHEDTLEKVFANKKHYSRPTLKTALALLSYRQQQGGKKLPSERDLADLFAGKKSLNHFRTAGRRLL